RLYAFGHPVSFPACWEIPSKGHYTHRESYPSAHGKAPGGDPKHVARGQSDGGAATPGRGEKIIPSPDRGGSELATAWSSAAPLGLGNKMGLLTRGRRSSVALPP